MARDQFEAGDQKPVLSFHDSLLRSSDLATLRKGCWLNDHIISFYMQYLEYNVFPNLQEDAAFLAAEVVQLIKLLNAQELQQAFSFLETKKLIFLPLNNCDKGKGGGSHWSLIIYCHGKFYYLDSAPTHIMPAAKNVVERLTTSIFKKEIPLLEMACASQTNCSDCGMYVLEFAELACAAYANAEPLSKKIFEKISPKNITDKRTAIVNIIETLRDSPAYTHR